MKRGVDGHDTAPHGPPVDHPQGHDRVSSRTRVEPLGQKLVYEVLHVVSAQVAKSDRAKLGPQVVPQRLRIPLTCWISPRNAAYLPLTIRQVFSRMVAEHGYPKDDSATNTLY